ncbi:uncharacterized protein LOC111119893 isoform X2 [Crassostrea virginica]
MVPAFGALDMEELEPPDVLPGLSHSESSSSSDQQENRTDYNVAPTREEPNPVKLSLKDKIQKKYIEKGQTPLHVSFDPPPKYELTEEEKHKQEQRKLRNRKSANVSREKRKHKEESLKKEVETLENDHKKLKREVQQLIVLRDKMDKTFKNHLARCQQTDERLKQKFGLAELEALKRSFSGTNGTVFNLSRKSKPATNVSPVSALDSHSVSTEPQSFSRQTSEGFDASGIPQFTGPEFL